MVRKLLLIDHNEATGSAGEGATETHTEQEKLGV